MKFDFKKVYGIYIFEFILRILENFDVNLDGNELMMNCCFIEFQNLFKISDKIFLGIVR